MQRKLDGKVVRFIAVDRKYRGTAYPAIAPLDSEINNYITGQHYDPNDKSTEGGLTIKEITGEIEIKPAGRAKLFPHVITDDTEVMIIHNKGYNCNLKEDGTPENPKDYAEAYFIIAQTRIVAINKDEVESHNKFYLQDKEADAKKFVINSDEAYEAEKLVREGATVTEYKDLLRMLNLSVKDFNVDYSNMSDTRMKEVLIKQAQNNPATIKFGFTEAGKDYLFLAKLIEHGIIIKKQDGYYDGEKFIAMDIDRFLAYMADGNNGQIVGKWGRLLKETELEIA